MRLLALFFTLMTCSLIAEEYERTIKDYFIENDEGIKVHFLLDNDGWFISEINSLDENKIYALDKLVGTRVFIETENSFGSGFVMICENPFNKGKRRISFSGSIPKETYDSALTVKELNFNFYFCSSCFVVLSDGSEWWFRKKVDLCAASSYWAVGDHVMITKTFDRDNSFYLVNMDVSGDFYYNYYKNNLEFWPHNRDVRKALVSPR